MSLEISKSAAATCPSTNKTRQNVGDMERVMSVAGGAALAFLGLQARSPRALLLMALGGGLIYRGVKGHCYLYEALGMHTNTPDAPEAVIPSAQGVHVLHSVTIQQPPAKLYAFWRELTNLPRFMKHVDAVEVLSSTRSKWTIDSSFGPVQWEAEILTDVPNQSISWKSCEGSSVACAGSVHFQELSAWKATQVDINLRYDAPGARAGAFLASLFGQSPEQFIKEDLRRFKQLMETGEIPTTSGQPVGKCGRCGT